MYLERRAFHHDDLGIEEINDFRDEVELAGHAVAIRCALLATVLLHRSDPVEISVALERLKTLDLMSGPTGAISFRYALAEFCAARLARDRDRLTALRREANRLEVRTRSWIPVECFLDAAGLPLRPVPTQWFEPYDVVRRRWVDHLHAYLARHAVIYDSG